MIKIGDDESFISTNCRQPCCADRSAAETACCEPDFFYRAIAQRLAIAGSWQCRGSAPRRPQVLAKFNKSSREPRGGSRRRLKAVAHPSRELFASADRCDRSPLRRYSGREAKGEEGGHLRPRPRSNVQAKTSASKAGLNARSLRLRCCATRLKGRCPV